MHYFDQKTKFAFTAVVVFGNQDCIIKDMLHLFLKVSLLTGTSYLLDTIFYFFISFFDKIYAKIVRKKGTQKRFH